VTDKAPTKVEIRPAVFKWLTVIGSLKWIIFHVPYVPLNDELEVCGAFMAISINSHCDVFFLSSMWLEWNRSWSVSRRISNLVEGRKECLWMAFAFAHTSTYTVAIQGWRYVDDLFFQHKNQ
jgi:hypothetical protein